MSNYPGLGRVQYVDTGYGPPPGPPPRSVDRWYPSSDPYGPPMDLIPARPADIVHACPCSGGSLPPPVPRDYYPPAAPQPTYYPPPPAGPSNDPNFEVGKLYRVVGIDRTTVPVLTSAPPPPQPKFVYSGYGPPPRMAQPQDPRLVSETNHKVYSYRR